MLNIKIFSNKHLLERGINQIKSEAQLCLGVSVHCNY